MFRRLLVRGTNWVGDSIMTIPALRELRRIFPTAHLTLMVRPWVADLFADTPLADDLLLYDNRRESFWSGVVKLRAGRFDAAVLFQNAFEAAALAFAARIPQRIGFATEARHLLLTDAFPVTPATRRKHQIYYYLDLVAQWETRLTGKTEVNYEALDYRLPVAADARAAVEAKLPDLGRHGYPVAIVPGAANSRAKQWPPQAFTALLDRLAERDELQLFLVGAPNEHPLCEAIRQGMRRPDRAATLAGELSLRESVAFLACCAVVVSNDTGPAYVAAALDRPLVTIFGPTDPNQISPFSPTARIVRKLVPCAPCLLKDCPIDHRCLTGVTPDMVCQAMLDALDTQNGLASRRDPH
ncbi:MAG: lipopolysaccharide heptosyltransferase II [Chloracidobacterium sp.]|uniref:lipopolysaccharide heptosyltransferase II n=1 Tax=Chloracidobacterium validum TaxID=2821543 RepID=A0ABX8BBJ9_9BACT|nr:lipopolysaccharide heptosyltransferase II [Chloracidobacterium validum]QUW04218.1 lipopolysaccharide heptosyltransferase II [Chloracidobacterium validum]